MFHVEQWRIHHVPGRFQPQRNGNRQNGIEIFRPAAPHDRALFHVEHYPRDAQRPKLLSAWPTRSFRHCWISIGLQKSSLARPAAGHLRMQFKRTQPWQHQSVIDQTCAGNGTQTGMAVAPADTGPWRPAAVGGINHLLAAHAPATTYRRTASLFHVEQTYSCP